MNDTALNGLCPVDKAIEVLGGKWKPLILHRLGAGTLRFGQLQRAIPLVTQRMLTLQLRELERDGLVVRTVYAQVPPKVEYTLAAPALSLLPVLESLGRWWLEHQGELREPQPTQPTQPVARPMKEDKASEGARSSPPQQQPVLPIAHG